MQNKLFNTIKIWIPFAVMATLLCGLIYVSVQQVYRQSANDPQIQIAEDISRALSNGVPPQAIANPNTTDISKSLATFIIIYNSSKVSVLSSAVLDGKTPQVPQGIFNSVGKSGQSRFTWEPKDGIRVAAVLQKYTGKTPGYILAGRSIREIEKREDFLKKGVGLAYIVTLIATFISIYFVDRFLNKGTTRRKLRK